MNKNLFFLFLAILLGNQPVIRAQSPYQLSLEKESLILGTGLISAAISSHIDDQIKPLSLVEIERLDKSNVDAFDRSATHYYSAQISKTSDVILGAFSCSPLVFLTMKETQRDAMIIGTMYAETLMFSVFLPSYGKGGVQRIRPYVYYSGTPMEKKLNSEAKRSFFSGHTTVAFSTAVFVSTVYSKYFPESKWKPVIWGSSFIAAGSVGFLRYRSGSHFPTDILVGAAIGSAIGYFIPKFHEVKCKSDLSIMPYIFDNKTGISLIYKL